MNRIVNWAPPRLPVQRDLQPKCWISQILPWPQAPPLRGWPSDQVRPSYWAHVIWVLFYVLKQKCQCFVSSRGRWHGCDVPGSRGPAGTGARCPGHQCQTKQSGYFLSCSRWSANALTDQYFLTRFHSKTWGLIFVTDSRIQGAAGDPVFGRPQGKKISQCEFRKVLLFWLWCCVSVAASLEMLSRECEGQPVIGRASLDIFSPVREGLTFLFCFNNGDFYECPLR